MNPKSPEFTCARFQSVLDEWRDGRLPPPDAGATDRHLAACPDCRARLAADESLGGLMRSLPRLTAPAGFEDRLRRRLAADRARTRRRRTLLLAAASLILTMAGTAPWWFRPTPPAEPLAGPLSTDPPPNGLVIPIRGLPARTPSAKIRFVTVDPRTGTELLVELPTALPPGDWAAVEAALIQEVSH